MTKRFASALLLFAFSLSQPVCQGFSLASSHHTRANWLVSQTAAWSSSSSSSLSLQVFSTRNGNEQDVGEIRADIARMKEEAIRRLEALNQKFREEVKEEDPFNPVLLDAEHADDPRVKQLVHMAEDFDREMQQPTGEILTSATPSEVENAASQDQESNMETNVEPADAVVIKSSHHQQETQKHPLKLLDHTRWRLMLNIGREPGTWMPKTWGASGDRLYLNLELEFSTEHLYERDDFFNGVSGSKVLKVVHNEANLAPSMAEGGRRVRVRDGGWRVVPKEGPLGTTVLRFYFDLEEETRHQGSDVYLPRGRIYCTCGYFPMEGRSGAHGELSTKEVLQKQLHEIESRYQRLQGENDADESLFSLGMLTRAKEMMDVRNQATKISKAIQEERVREPEKALLRLSQDQSVGLTREGGVCCKRDKGVAVEYHILGHFEIASMENREHSDYRKMLP